MKTIKERSNYIDIISGILIIHMISCHYPIVDSGTYGVMHDLLFFFMPWFYFKSGMFYRYSSECVIYTLKKLIVPFITFSIIGTLIRIFYTLITEGHGIYNDIYYDWCRFIYVGSTDWNAPLWFLFSLFCVKNIYNYFSKYSCYIIFLSFVLSVINYYYIDHDTLLIGGNICSGLFFYSLGDTLKLKQFKSSIFYTSILVYLFAICIYPSNISMFDNNVEPGGFYILGLLYPLAAIICANNIFSRYLNHELLSRTLGYIGRNSILLYIIHYPIGFFTTRTLSYYFPTIHPFILALTAWLVLLLSFLISKVVFKGCLSLLIGKGK